VFLEISRTCLAALMTHQATHVFRTHFLGFAMNRLAAVCCSPSDANWLAQFLLVYGVSTMLRCWIDFLYRIIWLALWFNVWGCLFDENCMNLCMFGGLGLMMGLGMRIYDFWSLIGIQVLWNWSSLKQCELYMFDWMLKVCLKFMTESIIGISRDVRVQENLGKTHNLYAPPGSTWTAPGDTLLQNGYSFSASCAVF